MIKQYVLFGDYAVQAAEEGTWTRVKRVCDSCPNAIGYRMFNTEAEREAYLLGLNDHAGWLSSYPLDSDEARQLGKRMRLSEVEDLADAY